MVPLATLTGNYGMRASYVYPDRIGTHFTLWFVYPWDNEEDGVLAGKELLEYPTWVRIIYWAAIRNPANNLRFLAPFKLHIDQNKVKFKLRMGTETITEKTSYDKLYIEAAEEGKLHNSFSYIATQGLHINYRKEFKAFGSYYRLWLGTAKIYPSDMYGLLPNDYRYYGTGPVMQLKRLRK